VLLELIPVALPHRCSLPFVLLEDITKLGKFQTLVAGSVFARLESVHDDGPLFELHSREGVAQVVYRIQDIAVGGYAPGVVEVVERLLEQQDEGSLGVCGVDAKGGEDVGALSPCSLRSQPRAGGDVLQ